MKESTKVWVGIGAAAAILGVGGFLLLGNKPAASTSGGGAANNGATLPASIPLVIGVPVRVTLPEMLGSAWVMQAKNNAVVSIVDVGTTGGGVGSPALHSFTLTGLQVGTSMIAATLYSSSTGQPVSGVPSLSATVTVSAAIGGVNQGGGSSSNQAGAKQSGTNFGVFTGGGFVVNQGGGAKNTGGATIKPGSNGGGGVVVFNPHGGGAQQAPPYVPKSYAVSWPNGVNQSVSTYGKQIGNPIALNVGDVVSFIFNDPTATPMCVPQAPQNSQDSRGGIFASGSTSTPGVYCNSWYTGWVDASGNTWGAAALDGGQMPITTMAGQESAASQAADQGVITFQATSPGRGTLVFSRYGLDNSGNNVVNLVFMMTVVVSAAP
jgi:hypothetical protein